MIIVGVLCLFAGATLGVFTTALMSAAGKADRCEECRRKQEGEK